MTAQQTFDAPVKISDLFGLDAATLKKNPEVAIKPPHEALAPYVPQIKSHKFYAEQVRDLYEFDRSGFRDGCLFITGPRGAGKSSGVEQFYARFGIPVFRATGHARLELADLIGITGLREGNTVFQHGPLTQAAKFGGVFLFDEADACPPEVLVGLHGILEMGDQFVISENGGEVIKIHPRFRVIVTGNTAGSGDNSGDYAGTVVQNSATLDRFNFLEWGYPEKEIELQILFAAVPELKAAPVIAETLINVADATRTKGGVESISTRALIRWSRKAIAFKGEPLKKSLDRAFTFRLDPTDRSEVYAVAAAHIGRDAFYGS